MAAPMRDGRDTQRAYRLRFGKFAGRTLSECPVDYVIYLANLNKPKTKERRVAQREALRYLKRKWTDSR